MVWKYPEMSVTASTVSQVIASRLPGYSEGDYVFNTNGWQRYGLSGDNIDVFGYMFPRKIDPDQAPISTAIGVMGMLGLTAYAGLIVQCAPQPGETVVVSAASGGVGQVVAQLGRLYGCRVVAIAGSNEKLSYLQDLGWMRRYPIALRILPMSLSRRALTVAISILKMSVDGYSRRSCRC